MSAGELLSDELELLVADLLDGTPTPDQQQRLFEILTDSATARDQYAQLISLHAMLEGEAAVMPTVAPVVANAFVADAIVAAPVIDTHTAPATTPALARPRNSRRVPGTGLTHADRTPQYVHSRDMTA